MQPIDPITLAIIAVVVALVLSALLLLLLVTREEKFEDVVAAQRAEQEVYVARNSSAKPVKQRKKIGKGKKKGQENGEILEEISAPSVEEIVEASVLNLDEEPYPFGSEDYQEDSNKIEKDEKPAVAEQQPSSVGVKERQGKKKSKKAAQKEEESSVTGRHAHFDKPREVVEEVIANAETIDVVEMAAPIVDSEVVEISAISVEAKPEGQFPVVHETAPLGKKAKNKTKTVKDKGTIQGDVSSKRLMEMVTSSNLNSSEVQDLIDVLLNKQGENNQWKTSSSKGDAVEMLKKQLLEKENQIVEEHQHAQSAANKLRELRDELQQEKQKYKHQQTHASNKITSQAKEIQAMESRMKASHESHAMELQAVQTQMVQLQEVMQTSSVGNLQRLQEEIAQLKNASMRAAQLTSDKESLTAELTKLQQSHRQVKGDLANKAELLAKSDAQRKTAEEQISWLNIQHNNKQEAENALAKRLGEVNEELNKSKAKDTSLQKELNAMTQMLRSEESKAKELTERLKGLEAADTSQALTAKLQEATARVSELEKMFTGVEHQLKDSQDVQLQKDKEIQILQDELKLARESVQQSAVTNHVDVPSENGKQSTKAHEDVLKVKEDVIAELHGNVLKKDEEIASLKSSLDEQKDKNNALRQKNWKAMEALSLAEKNTQAQINKALEAAKEASVDGVAVGQNDVLKERDETIEKLHEELKDKKDEFTKLEDVVAKQKEKNNELREKNWKAMDALAETERNVNNKVKSAVQSVKDENKTFVAEEQNTTKTALCRIHPSVEVDSSLPYKKWLNEFEKQALECSQDSQEVEDLTRNFEEVQNQKDNLMAECAYYKVTLQDTESLLKKLEENVESEMENWQKIVERAQRELKEANDRISNLEEDLDKTKVSATSQLDTVASLEQRLLQARTAESEAKQRFVQLQEQLAKSSVPSQDAVENIARLEKELASCKGKEKELTDKIARLESTEKDVVKYKKQLDNAAKELAGCDKERKTSIGEVLNLRSVEEELKKKVASLEESLAKASNDLGKSEESLDINSSPEKSEKKKKGLKGAFNKVMSKKDKDKEKDKDDKEKTAQLEEAQKQLALYKTQIDDLKNARDSLVKRNKILEDENKRRSISADAEMGQSNQIEEDIKEAMSDGAAQNAS